MEQKLLYQTVGNQLNPLNFQNMVTTMINEGLKKRLSGYDQKHVKATAYNPEKQVHKEKESGAIVKPYEVYEAIEGYEGVPPWKVSNELTPIMNAKKFADAKEKYAKGSVSSDFMLFNHISEPYQEIAKRWYDQLKYGSASVITSGDFGTIKQAQMLVSLINIEERSYTIDQSFNTVQSSDIVVDIDTYHRFQLGAYDKGEFETVEPLKGSYDVQQVRMRKAMGALEWSDEATMMPWRHNVIGDHMQNLTSDFRRVKVEKVADTYTAIATETTGGGNILAFDTGTEHSLINPFLIIGNAMSEIDDAPNNGMAAVAAMHPTTWRKLLMNSWGRSLLAAVSVGPTRSTIIQGPRGYEELTFYLDKVLPTGKIFIIDPRWSYIIQGPIMTENVRDSNRGANAIIIRDFHKVVNVRSAATTRFITAT